MASKNAYRTRRAWDAPDCPNGHLDIYVDTAKSPDGQWQCFKCDEVFDE